MQPKSMEQERASVSINRLILSTKSIMAFALTIGVILFLTKEYH